MSISTEIITSLNEVVKIEKDIDAFLHAHSENPFMLSKFAICAMQLYSGSDSLPAVLVSRLNGEVVGISYILFRQFLGGRVAMFLLNDAMSPDFVLEGKYREDLLNHTFTVLFKKMKCQAVQLTFPVESPNLKVLERLCPENRVALYRDVNLTIGHRILSIQSSWAEFQKMRGKAFRKRFRATERELCKAGNWAVNSVENICDNQTADLALQKILSVEALSWKQNWRAQVGKTTDADLLWVWAASVSLVKTNPFFKLDLLFLELNNQSVAYSMVIRYKGTAVAAKTSFVEKYRKLGLGIYINNVLIQNLFDKQDIARVDFMTNLSYMGVWTHDALPRVRYLIRKRTPSSFLLLAVEKAKKSSAVRAMGKRLSLTNTL